MTSQEFVVWLKGFMKATNPYDIKSSHWYDILEELKKVDDSMQSNANPTKSGTVKMNGANTTYTYPVGGISNLTTVIDENPKTLLNG